MLSKFRIDFAGMDDSNSFQPVIRVDVQDSEDVRDGLCRSFFQALGGDSSWLRVNFHSDIIDGVAQPQRITIYPVRENELELMKEMVDSRILLQRIFHNRINDNHVNTITLSEDPVAWGGYNYIVNTEKSLKGIREDVLKRAIDEVINNPDNYVKE